MGKPEDKIRYEVKRPFVHAGLNLRPIYRLFASSLFILMLQTMHAQDKDAPYHGGIGDGYAKGVWANQQTNIESLSNKKVRVFPNPMKTGENLNIENATSFYETFQIIDVLGKTVVSAENLEYATIQKSIQELILPPATYFLVLEWNGRSDRIKFVVF